MYGKILIFICVAFLLCACSKDKIIYEPSDKIDPYTLYKEAMDSFEINDFVAANKKFSEAEINFSDPTLAAKSSIMSSFCLYSLNFFEEAEESLNRYLKNYPGDKNVIYANYLLAIVYFFLIK